MRHRLEFAGKKCIRMMLLLLGVSLAAFLLMAASPLDPLQTNVGQVALGSMSPEQVAQLEDYWGTNTPLPERYLGWLADAVREMQLRDIVLETDCPYLTPAPHRGERNESAYVRYVCEKVAELKGLTPGETAEATTANAERIFGK